jgi:hypothetical protein
MAAMQETEDLGKVPATSVARIHTMGKLVDRTEWLIRNLIRFLSGFLGRLIRTPRTVFRGVRPIGLNIIGRRGASMDDEVKQFADHFSRQLVEIDEVEPHLFRKILLMGVIDALSRAALPTVSGPRQRVTQFIESYSGWQDHNRVSAQQLLLNLIDSGTDSGQLYDVAQKRVSAWRDGHIIRPAEDLSFREADSIATSAEKVHVKDATYL